MALPTRGQPNWDDEVSNHLSGMEAGIAAAAAAAVVASSDATYARNRADEVHTAVVGGADATTAINIESESSASAGALAAAAANAGHPLGVALSATFARGANVYADATHGIGTGDDTAYLQAKVDALAGFGLETITIHDGTWMIEATGADGANRGLVLPSNTNLVIKPAATLQAIANNLTVSSVISVALAENVTISGGGTIIGERVAHVGATGEHGMGITLLHVSNVVVENLTIKDCWGDCIYVGGNNWGISSADPCTNVLIQNCTLDNARRQGVSVTLGEDIRIRDCVVTNINGVAPEYGIDIETNDITKPCRRVSIEGCYFTGSTGGGVVIGSTSEDVSLTGCTFVGNGFAALKTTRLTVTRNSFVSTTALVQSSSAVTFANNTLKSSGFQVDVSSAALSHVNVTGNVFTNDDGDATRRAIQVAGTTYTLTGLTVTGNKVSEFKAHSLYISTQVVDATITGNTFTSSVLTGSMMHLRLTDSLVGNNNLTVTASATLSAKIIDASMIRGSFVGNVVRASSTVTLNESVAAFNTLAGETVGATITGNRFAASNGTAIKFTTTSETAYRVFGNDFRAFATAFTNGTSPHYFTQNYASGTPGEAFGIAAPTTGTAARGDRVFNSLPSSGGYLGWVCVTAGTPGTWAPFGQIAVRTATTASLASLADTVNTTDKFAGKTVFNTTTGKLVTAVGATAASAWNDQTGTLAHTPV